MIGSALNIFGPRAFAAYVYSLRLYIYVVVAVMIISAGAGIGIAFAFPDQVLSTLKMMAEQDSFAGADNVFTLFLHNVQSGLISLVLGLLFMVPAILFTALEWLLIGVIIGYGLFKMGLVMTVIALVPHGILEIPAAVIMTAIGLRLGHCGLLALRRKQWVTLQKELVEGVCILIVWLLPMLFVAAVIETYVTPALMGLK